MEASSKATSRRFIFICFFLPHWVPATCRGRAQISIKAELPSGKLPTTRVRQRISRFSRSITLLVRMRVQCSLGKSQQVSVAPIPSFTLLAASSNSMERSFSTTVLAFSRVAFLFSYARMALEHFGDQLHLDPRCDRKHVTVKVDGTTLVLGLRKHFSHSLQHTKALVANDEFHTIQATPAEPLREAYPAGLVHLHPLSGAQNLTVSVLVDCNCHKDSYIFKLSSLVAEQVDHIHMDIRIASALQRTVPPILHVDIRFLVQLTDGGEKELAVPESLGDILHTPDRYACQAQMSASSTLLSRRRYRSMMAVLKEISLSLGTLRVTSPEVVVRLRCSGLCGNPDAARYARTGPLV